MRASRLSTLWCLAGLLALAGVAPRSQGGRLVDLGFVANRSAQSSWPDSALAGVTFDSVWSRVGSTYFDPDMGGVDWEAARSELRPRALSASSNEELRTVLEELLGRLRASHFVVLPGRSAPALERPDQPNAVGGGDPGIDLRWVAGDILVTRVRPGAPAERAGVRPGWIVDEVGDTAVDTLAGLLRGARDPEGGDGRLALWLPSAVLARLRGEEGSSVRVAFRDGRGEGRSLLLSRAAPPGEVVRFGNLPPIQLEVDHRMERLRGGLTVGIIRFTAWFPAAVPAIAQAVDDLRDSDAIVLDLRGNPGGVGALVMGVGGHFVNEAVSLGTMRTRDGALEFVVNPQRVTPEGRRVQPYGGPLLILVDRLTASTSEIFAGGMQAIGRATIVGDTTAGQALPALVVPLPNGDLLMHAVADFTEPDGTRIEGRGVLPDVPVPLDRAALLEGSDPILQGALQWLQDARSR